MESILRIDALAAEWVGHDCEDVLHGESNCFDIVMKMSLTYEFDENQIVVLWILYLYITKPHDTNIISYAESSYHKTLHKFLVLFFDHCIKPFLSTIESMKNGPICSFLPETFVCNMSKDFFQKKLINKEL